MSKHLPALAQLAAALSSLGDHAVRLRLRGRVRVRVRVRVNRNPNLGDHAVGGAGRLGDRLVRALLEPVQLALHLGRVRARVRVRVTFTVRVGLGLGLGMDMGMGMRMVAPARPPRW